MSAITIIEELNRLKNPAQAINLQRFFKTGPGQYGEGDVFLGIKVPVQREVAKANLGASLKDLQELLDSKIHEHRLVALLILVYKFDKAAEEERKKIFKFYLANTRNINNWDLVDVTTPNIIGEYLQDKDRSILYKLAKSNNLWERRISILATFAFIRNGEAKDTLAIAEMLLDDKHDLIHKAVGWMLREVGKRVSEKELEKFLNAHCNQMPRTMLRYAIERLPENKRKGFLHRK